MGNYRRIRSAISIAASLVLVSCGTGIDGLSDGEIATLSFGSVSNPTTLSLGESVTFSVYYQGEVLELSGCHVENSIGELVSGDGLGAISNTSTECTYTAPDALPATDIVAQLQKALSSLDINVVATIADAEPALEATLGIVVTGEEVSCGDGVAEMGEECDDGNLLSGDGCSDQCVSECEVNSEGCSSLCENGGYTYEECSEGDMIEGCTLYGEIWCGSVNECGQIKIQNICDNTNGSCHWASGACTDGPGDIPVCGNAICEDGETPESCMYDCTDGPACDPETLASVFDGDCSADEQLYSYAFLSMFCGADTAICLTQYACDHSEDSCMTQGMVGAAVAGGCDISSCGGESSGECGNGVRENDPWEQCDDGNTNDGDGCSSSCIAEIGALCESNAGCNMSISRCYEGVCTSYADMYLAVPRCEYICRVFDSNYEDFPEDAVECSAEYADGKCSWDGNDWGAYDSNCTDYGHDFCTVMQEVGGSCIWVIDHCEDTSKIEVSISNLDGTVVLQLNGDEELTLTAVDGGFDNGEFDTQMALGDPYNITVLSSPEGQTCVVNNGSGIAGVGGDPYVSVYAACNANTYTVSGSISGLTGTVVISNRGEEELTISDDGPFNFVTPLPTGASYLMIIEEQPAGQVCTVSAGVGGTIQDENITNVEINCTAEGYTISGTYTGVAGSWVYVTLGLNNGEGSIIAVEGKALTSSGAYSFTTPLISGTNYWVSIGAMPAHVYCSGNSSGTISGNVVNADITCERTYTLNANISGQNSGFIVNVTYDTPIGTGSSTGSIGVVTTSYELTDNIVSGADYEIVIRDDQQPTGQTCVIDGATGTMTPSGATATITCSDNPPDSEYSVGVWMLSLAEGLVLQNNGGDDLTVNVVEGGSYFFYFPTGLTNGSPYDITVLTNPDGKTCTITFGGSGTISGKGALAQVTCD